MIIIKRHVTFILLVCLFVAGSTYVSADNSSNHVFGGKNTNGGVFKYWKDSSVTSYGYGTTISNSVNNWNAVPNAGILLFETSDASVAEIKYYVTNNELGSGVYGAADCWERDGSTLTLISTSNVIGGTNFDMTRIRLDHGRMATAGYTTSERDHNTGHETGHAMSLHHFDLSPTHSGNHWMKSGKISLTSPTSTDADHLVWKWPVP